MAATVRNKTMARKRKKASRGLRCPECGFIAAHPMGLGRHRSTRHGAVSKRQQMRRSAGGWLTRREAARRAGVHYNTIRQWEQAGLVRKTRRPGVRGALISASDLARLLAERSAASGLVSDRADPVALAALERRYRELIAGLEQILETARVSVPARKGKRTSRKKTTARAKMGPARTGARKRR